MRKILDFIDISKCGFFEIIIAIYPVLAGYAYGVIHLNDVVLLLLCVIAYIKTQSAQQYKCFKILAVFIIIHELIVWVGFTDMPIYMINNTLSTLICVISISIIAPAVDFNKYYHSIVLVAIILSLGIAYHFAMIKTGHSVTPIPLPFLPELPSTSRMFEMGVRPVSFFWEPAGYANYMLVPLMIFMIEKRYEMVAASMVFMFLSTSSTAILLSLIMAGLYLITSSKTGFTIKFVFALLMIGMVYFLLNSDLFSAGVDKIESTEVETTSRLFNGPELFRFMPSLHFITGIPAANISDYYLNTSYLAGASLFVKNDTVFIPTFYLITAKFGVIGLVLYLLTILKPAFDNRDVWPYVGVKIVAMFFAGNAITSMYVFEMIFLYTYLLNRNDLEYEPEN